MNQSGHRDAAAILVLAGAIALVVVANWLSGLDLEAVAANLQQLLSVLVVAALLLAGLLLVRSAATRHALRSRVRLLVAPGPDLEPSLDAVLRFAAQLARTRRSVRGWFDLRASAIRVRLEPDADGAFTYALEVPARARELVVSALRTYGRIELREPPDQPAPAGRRSNAVRAELVLERASVEPLARLGLDPDPLDAFAVAMRGQRPEAGERAIVCVDLLPVAPYERRRVRRRLRREAARGHGLGGLLSPAPSKSRGPAAPIDLAERRSEARALDHKLDESGALFRLQVLIRCEAGARGRAKRQLQELLACFDQLAAENALRVRGLRVPGIAFLGSDLPARRRRFDRRLASGLFRPARRGVVTAHEVAGFLKPPTACCTADNLLRATGLAAPAPRRLPQFDGQHDLLPLGRVAGEGGERTVGARLADTFFVYIAGRSRYGKTELALGQFLHLVRSGHGGLFLDPHADALERLRPALDAAGLRERVVEINLAQPASEPRVGWNLFDLAAADAAADAAAAEARVDAVVDALASALRWDERNTRALTVATQAASALAHLARALPPELAPTLFQVPTLLSDERWRAAALVHAPRATQSFFAERFPRLPDDAITPVTNLIDRLRASAQTACVLGQSSGGYRAREAMDAGLIVLACPGGGGTRDRLVANFLVYDLLHAAKARADLAPEQRRPFFCFLDEVQSYDGAASGNLAALLEQTAKYGLRAVLLNQNPERLTPATLNAITTNRSHLLATAMNAKAAGLIAREWGGEPDAATIAGLPRFSFLAQVIDRGALSRPFRLAALRFEDLPAAQPRPTAGQGSEVPARAAEEVLAELDTLDERILAALGASDPDEPRGRPGRVELGPPASAGERA
jgi:hypothetical protein